MPQFKRLLRERIEAPDEAVPVVTPAVTLHPIVHAQKMRMRDLLHVKLARAASNSL